jgi:hypothetical protein
VGGKYRVDSFDDGSLNLVLVGDAEEQEKPDILTIKVDFPGLRDHSFKKNLI